jgi:hypothetical protein
MLIRQQPNAAFLRRLAYIIGGLLCFAAAGPLFDTPFRTMAPALILVGLGCLASAATVGW